MNESTSVNTPEPMPVDRFLKDETGGVLLEYVVLLIMVFITVFVTVQPFHNALMWFAEQVFDHLHYA